MAYITKFNGSTDATIKLGGEGNPTSIEGYFLGSKDTQSDYGPGKLHIFKTKEGTIGVWGKTRMNNQLTSDLKGQMVLVTFTGMVAPSKKGRKPSYGYEVQHDPDNSIDVTGINLGAQEPEAEEDFIEEDAADEAAPAPVVRAPAIAARTPSADSQARVQALLNKGRTSRTA